MQFFIEQKIAETRRFINFMHEQAHSSRIRLAQLNAMISEMEAMNDPEEFYDALFCLRHDKRVEYNKIMAINDVIAKAEEKLTTKEAHLEIMEAEINLFQGWGWFVLSMDVVWIKNFILMKYVSVSLIVS
nr:hypothetical protein [Tanacetum cinerariifolium]